MIFCIWMVAVSLIIPITMIIFGKLFFDKAPADINYVFGYRTRRSMRNRLTWEFAHKRIGRLWRRLGLIMLPVSAAAMTVCYGKSMEFVGWLNIVIMSVQIAVLIGTIFPVEKALKENFDEYGVPRE